MTFADLAIATRLKQSKMANPSQYKLPVEVSAAS